MLYLNKLEFFLFEIIDYDLQEDTVAYLYESRGGPDISFFINVEAFLNDNEIIGWI